MTEDAGCRLPQELADMVIDHLHDDRRSLRQCSLTCKAWEPSSTAHLFSRLSWPPHKAYWSFPEEIKAPRDDPYYTVSFEDCYDLLSSSSRICNAVRHLRLTGLRSRGRGGLPHSQSHEPLPLTLLFALPELLPGLHTLDIWDLAFGVLEPPPQTSLELPRGLKKLAFLGTGVIYDDLCFFSIISAFSHIDTIVFDCTCEEFDEGLPLMMQISRRFPKTSVRRLEIAYPLDLFPVLLRLRHQLDLAALREVEVDNRLDENLGTLIAFAPRLEALTYTTDGFIPPTLINPAALRSLNLTCISVVMDPDAPQFRAFDLGKMILNAASLNAPNLSELTLAISLSAEYRVTEMTLSEEAFASALARRLEDEDCQFEALSRVVMKAQQSLRRLKIVVLVDDPWKLNSLRFMVPYLACSAQVLRDAVVKALGQSVEGILEVTAEHRCEGDVIVYYP